MYKKILVPLDTSTLAECTLAHVKAIARGLKVPEVVLLSALSPVKQWWMDDGTIPDDWLRENEAKAIGYVKSYLAKMADSLKKDGITTEIIVVSGEPAEVILDYVKKKPVDLIVMSTHGRTGVTRWLLGGVADRVIRYSAVPVLVIPPAGCRVG